MVQLPGFEPGSLTWQARILTKLYYNCNNPRGKIWILNCFLINVFQHVYLIKQIFYFYENSYDI